MLRTLLGMAVFSVLAIPADAAPIPRDPPKGAPHLVVQFKPLDGWLADYGHVQAKIKVHPQYESLPDVENLKKLITPLLENWETAFDPTRPWGLYLVFRPEFEQMRPVFMIPTKDYKEFQKAIAQIFIKSDEGDDGISTFKYNFFGFGGGGGHAIFYRFKDDYVYLTPLDKSALETLKDLPAPRDLFVKEDTSLISARLYVEGIPPELKKVARDFLAEFGKEVERTPDDLPMMFLRGLIGADDNKDFISQLRRLIDESKWLSLRWEFDRKSDETFLEFNLIPVKDSALGKQIAAFKPRPSRFAGLLENDTMLGGIYNVGAFGGLKGDSKIFDKSLLELLKEIQLDGDENVVSSLATVLRNSLKVDGVDIGLALKPSRDGKTVCLVGGAQLQKARNLETAMLIYMNLLPEKKRKRFQAKSTKIAEGVMAHKLTLELSENAQDCLGDRDMYFLFRDDAVFFAIGDRATDRLQEMLELKPKDGSALRIEMKPREFAPFAEVIFGEHLERVWKKVFPANTKIRLLSMDLEGGPMLRIRYTTDLISILKLAEER